MDHQTVERKNSVSPPPPSSSSNGIQDTNHEERRTFAGLNSAVMAADLAGAATAGIMNEEYQKVLQLRQQQIDEQFSALHRQNQLQEHFRLILQSHHEQQNVVNNQHLRQLEEQRQQHNDLVSRVVNKDKSLESANASPSVKKHLHNFVLGRRKHKPYEGYPNNVANRLRWTPSLDSRNGVHDLTAPYPHLFDKRNSFPLRKTASEPNLKVKSSRFRKLPSDRRCSPLLPRQSAENRADLADRIKRKINSDQAAADNSASSSAPNSGPSSPSNSNSNINHSSSSTNATPARGIGALPSGSLETELPNYSVPLHFGLGPREIYASPSLPNISLDLSQKKTDPNAMITGTPPGMMMYPDPELQRLVFRTSSLPSPFMQQIYKRQVGLGDMDFALRNYILQQQLVTAGLAGADKDTPGPIRHAAQTRPHKTLIRTHSAPTTTAQLQQHLFQKKRMLLHQPQHKHAPHLISGLAAEPTYRPLATHREASEPAESSSSTSSSASKQRKQKLAASPPPIHPSAISSDTLAKLHSKLNKNSNKNVNQFPKQMDSKASPPSARHTSMEHSQSTPEKSSRSVIVGPQRSSSEEDQDVVVVKRERPDVSEDLSSSYPPQSGHRQLAAMAVQDKSHDHMPSKPSPLHAKRSVLRAEMGSHQPLTRTQSLPAVSFTQKHKHKEYKYTTGLAYDPIMLRHGCACGDTHAVEHAGRLKAVWHRLKDVELVDTCEVIDSRKATMEELQLAHTQEHTIRYGATPLARQQSALPDKFIVLSCGGVGIDVDTVWNEQDTTNAARMAVGLTVDLALSVASQELKNGFAIVRPPGHHAEKNLAMAFCYFNSVAVAARQLQRTYPDKIRRILIIDWDVHHCNGTQDIFYDDDSVLVISIHRYDEGNFFPGTGAPDETGAGPGVGFNVNIGFSQSSHDPAVGDAEYLAAFRSVVMPIAEEFNPDFVFVSAGFSAADGHPSTLGGYKVTPQCFSYLTRILSQLANGKMVMALEGGFELIPLCDCVEICIRTLLMEDSKDNTIAKLSEPSLKSTPCDSAVRSINKISRVQERYWSRLKRMSAYIGVSHAVYLGQEQEDRACVALASLSVEHSNQMDSKAKLREVLKRSKGPRIEVTPQESNTDLDQEEPKLTIVADDADDTPAHNRDEAMSAESSPLDVVGLSSPSSESPAASPKNQNFVSQEVALNSSVLHHGQNGNDEAMSGSKDEPMEEDRSANVDGT